MEFQGNYPAAGHFGLISTVNTSDVDNGNFI